MTIWNVRLGDCRELLRAMPAESVAACLCDPPYGLEFMGKDWDHGVPGVPYWAEVLRVMKPGGVLMAFGGTRTHHRLMVAIEDAGFEIFDTMMFLYGSGFPKSHDISKAIDKATIVACSACFGGGVRWTDEEMTDDEWLDYAALNPCPKCKGTGEIKGAEREVVGENPNAVGRTSNITGGRFIGHHKQDRASVDMLTSPATPDAATWQGYGTALKPAWEPVVLARKPRTGTYAEMALQHGSGGLWIDGGRIGTTTETHANRNAQDCPRVGAGDDGHGGYTKNLKTELHNHGRWPANLLLSHSPGCVRRGERRVKSDRNTQRNPERPSNPYHLTAPGFDNSAPIAPWGYADADGLETIADWDCVPDCAVRLLGEQSGERPSPSSNSSATQRGLAGTSTFRIHARPLQPGYADTGTAARFFKNFDPPLRFRYSAKASRAERDAGLEGMPLKGGHLASPEGGGGGWAKDSAKNPNYPRRNSHPCLKPLAVTRYLATLLLPPGAYLDDATILIPFCGVASEMIGALLAGWRNVVGIELQQEYVDIAEARLEWWGKAMALTHETEPQAILAAMKGRDIDDPVQAPMFNGPLT